MKVDKSVCTNDIHDLNRVIKFEKIFATLVENKVLAIKKDCEQKKRNKRLRSIRRILICKKKDLTETGLFQQNAKERKKSASNSEIAVKKDNDVDTIKLYDIQTSVKTTDIESVAKDDREIELDELTTDNNDDINIEQATLVSSADILPEYVVKIFENTDKDIDRLSQIEKYSKDTLQDASLCEIQSTLSDPIHSIRKHLINNQLGKSPKSVSAQSSPILTNKHLEISLGSDVNCSSESQPSKNASPFTQKQIFPKLSDKQSATATTSNLNLNNNESLTKSNQINNTEKTSPNKNIKSQIKLAKHSTLSSSKINKSNNNSVKKKSKHLKTIRGDALTIGLPHHLEYELEDYGDDDDDKSQHGFISSFNQLTTNVRVIAATKPKKSICNKSHLDKVVSTSSSAKTGAPVNKEIEDIECRTTTTVAVELCNETITAKKKRASTRRSEPVLAYPSSGQCILTRPPNQPIQLQYDEDYMFDVSLHLENGNGNLDAILSDRKKTKHRHHHHHHHNHPKKHKKRQKMLVHDLDNQKVKVIDPDDLPQRARWTIIATAFLLLIMCLLLVGVTLRMAPIIDDMVRQENERLMQESMNRAKYARNFTESPLAHTDGNNII